MVSEVSETPSVQTYRHIRRRLSLLKLDRVAGDASYEIRNHPASSFDSCAVQLDDANTSALEPLESGKILFLARTDRVHGFASDGRRVCRRKRLVFLF